MAKKAAVAKKTETAIEENPLRTAHPNIRVGVGGWTFEPWRGVFYPDGLAQKRELEYASRQLSSIEINGTYYGAQKPERFMSSGLSELKGKLGPIDWQFHPSKKFDPDDFGAFLKFLPKTLDGHKVRHVVEVRNESFSAPDFIELARDHNVAIVCAEGNGYVQIPDVTADFVYARITITDDKVKNGFTDATAKKWAEAALAWAAGETPKGLKPIGPVPKGKAKPRDVFLYVIGGHKVCNPAAAQAIMKHLG
jgi:uncharacterized protein YecE (DUF72 family)